MGAGAAAKRQRCRRYSPPLLPTGFHCALVPLFDPRFSPRNLVLVATRTPLGTVLAGLDEDSSEDEDTAGAEPPREGQSPPPPGAGHQPQ